MMGRLGLTLLLMTFLAAPASSVMAGHVEMRFESAQDVRLVMDGEMPGSEADFLRRRSDLDGNGQINATEVTAAEARGVGLVSGAPLGPPVGRLYVNGSEHLSTDGVELQYDGLEGPMDGRPAQARWEYVMHFPVSKGPFNLTLDLGNQSKAGMVPMEIESAALHAPPGYRVTAAGGLPLYAAVSEGKDRIDFSGGLRRGPGTILVVLEEAPADSAGKSAGSGPLPAMLALVICAQLAWRRTW